MSTLNTGMSVSTPTPVIPGPAEGITSVFETSVVVNQAALKPVLEWLVATVKGMEGKMVAAHSDPDQNSSDQSRSQKKPAWSGLQDHVKELTTRVIATEESLQASGATRNHVQDAIAAAEARMTAQMDALREEMQQNAASVAEEATVVAEERRAVAAAASAEDGAAAGAVRLEAMVTESNTEIKQLRADMLEKISMIEIQIPRKADGTAMAGLEEQVKSLEMRLTAAKDEEERVGRLVRGMQERHQMQQERIVEQQEHQEKLEEQCVMLREKVSLVEKTASGPPQRIDLGDGERDLVAETMVAVDALDKRCHDSEWIVRKLEQQVAQCTALMTQNVARIGPMEEEIARKADARGLEALVQQLGQNAAANQREISMVPEPKATVQQPSADGAPGFYDQEYSTSAGAPAADNGEAMEAISGIRLQLNAQSAQLNALRSKASCTVDRADLEEAISSMEINLKEDLNTHVKRLGSQLELATEERSRITLRCDSHDSMLDGIIPMLRQPITTGRAEAAPVSPAPTASAPAAAAPAKNTGSSSADASPGLDRLNFQLQMLEQKVNDLGGSRIQDNADLSELAQAPDTAAMGNRLNDAELRITELIAHVSELSETISSMPAEMSRGLSNSSNEEPKSPTNAGASGKDEIQALKKKDRAVDRTQKNMSQGITMISGIVRQNAEMVETLKVKLATMNHSLIELKKKQQLTDGLVGGKLDTADARWLVKQEDLEVLEKNVQKVAKDLTFKADKDLLEEFMKQREELAEANGTKPNELSMEESFNEQDLKMRTAINNSIAELRRHSEQLHTLQMAVGHKSSVEQVDMLARLVEHLKEKVDRVPTIIQAGENGVLFELSALKQSVTTLFKEQKRTDAVQSREIAEIEAKMEELGCTIEEMGLAVEAIEQEEITRPRTGSGGPGRKLPVGKSNRRGSVSTKSRRGSVSLDAAAASAVSQEALVTDVAEAVHGVFAQRFRAIDQSLQHKVDVSEFQKRLLELKQIFREQMPKQPWSPSHELKDVGTPEGHFVTGALPASIVLNPRKYAHERHLSPPPDNLVLPRLVPPSTLK